MGTLVNQKTLDKVEKTSHELGKDTLKHTQMIMGQYGKSIKNSYQPIRKTTNNALENWTEDRDTLQRRKYS